MAERSNALRPSATEHGFADKLEKKLTKLASDIAAHPNGLYAIAGRVSGGSHTASVVATSLGGIVEGLGNTITNLTITDSHDPDPSQRRSSA